VNPHLLAEALVQGARAEVDLTPKPGLVDRHDNGSHPDLDRARMMRSVDLLPPYYEELIGLRIRAGGPAAAGSRSGVLRPLEAGREVLWDEAEAPRPKPDRAQSLSSCIEAGRRAEARMQEAIGSNTHRGYIFLSGLVLLAACDLAEESRGAFLKGAPDDDREQFTTGPRCSGMDDGTIGPDLPLVALRRAIGSVASAFFDAAIPLDSPASTPGRPGARVRDGYGLGGVRAESLAGLPSVFEVGLPAYLAARDQSPERDVAAYHALAALMQRVEDTTAVARCGIDGLARLCRDGSALQMILERGADPRPALSLWNDEYRAQRLTMGGVTDCLALVLAFGPKAKRAGSL
jgi:triphosphoribosyl-dephospho-CoA synthase